MIRPCVIRMSQLSPQTDLPARTESFAHLDYTGFAAELKTLRSRLDAERGPADFAHLKRVERIGRASSFIGLLTAAMAVNPISIFLLSLGSFIRWTMVTHHVSHRGYNRIANIPERYTSQGFAKGLRRFLDWFDWMHPEAWNQEHNVFHHYYTSEIEDPDVVETNVAAIRAWSGPVWVKSVFLFFFACTWKLTYYAPSTFRILLRVRERQNATGERGKLRGVMPRDRSDEAPYGLMFLPTHAAGREFWMRCLLPYGLGRFVALPLLFLPLGKSAALAVLVNLLLAEVLTNIHSFIVIVTNHAGDDLYRFDEPIQHRDEFFVRQVISSVNFRTGGGMNDLMHGWLNYQIEHHLWPDLTMLQYQKAQPLVKALCNRYQVPYLQQSVWLRVIQLWRIYVGKSAMRKADTTPAALGAPEFVSV